MQLTRKQAFELSIRKWEALSEGKSIPQDILDLNLIYNCGLCQKYFFTSNKSLIMCAKCPIRPRISEYDYKLGSGCGQPGHPWHKRCYYKTPENAKAVLELIKSKR